MNLDLNEPVAELKTAATEAAANQVADVDLVIRPAWRTELPSLLPIYNLARERANCFRQSSVDYAGFQALVRDEEILVALRGSRFVGFLSILPQDRFIHHLYVEPAAQGLGVGSRLIQACEQRYGLPLSL